MVDCKLCGEKIEKGPEYILEGKYPSGFKRYFNWDFYGLDYYGDCYHRSCFIDKVKKEDFNR